MIFIYAVIIISSAILYVVGAARRDRETKKREIEEMFPWLNIQG